jgi:hypothetical protein
VEKVIGGDTVETLTKLNDFAEWHAELLSVES